MSQLLLTKSVYLFLLLLILDLQKAKVRFQSVRFERVRYNTVHKYKYTHKLNMPH